MLAPTAHEVLDVMESKGHKVFTDERGYDLNIFGIRTKDMMANTFNDFVGVMYRYEQFWNYFLFPATTDPGTYWREHPMNVNGTAILKPGQYRGSHKLGEHKGYPALQQKSPMIVYRDPDRDNLLEMDEESTEEGIFGINIHRASSENPSTQVNKWSAGCQVIRDPLQFRFLISLVEKSAEKYGNSFTYTLLTEEDFSS